MNNADTKTLRDLHRLADLDIEIASKHIIPDGDHVPIVEVVFWLKSSVDTKYPPLVDALAKQLNVGSITEVSRESQRGPEKGIAFQPRLHEALAITMAVPVLDKPTVRADIENGLDAWLANNQAVTVPRTR